MTSTTSLALLAAAAAVTTGTLIWRAAKARKAARADYFSQCLSLFDRHDRHIGPTGFARITGYRSGRTYDLQAIPDTLTYRKLPSLWVMATLVGPTPVAGTLDIMARPGGQEVFSRYAGLPHMLPCPPCLPEGTGLRSDNAAGVPDATLVARHAGVFDDVRTKELVIAPKGLRIVLQGDQAERSGYLLFRDAEVGRQPLAARRLAPVLAALDALYADLISGARA